MKFVYEYNKTLIDNLTKVDLITYFRNVQSYYYNDIDITFMDYFLDNYTGKNKFNISTDKFIEYNIISYKRVNKQIKKLISKNNLIEGEDYSINVVGDNIFPYKFFTSSVFVSKAIYTFNANSFKLCLLKSDNSNKYIKYYLLLEKIFKGYIEYQYYINTKISLIKDNKIDNKTQLIKKQLKIMNTQSKIMNDQNNKIKELLIFANEIKNKTDNIDKNIISINNNMNDINNIFKPDIKSIEDKIKDNEELDL